MTATLTPTQRALTKGKIKARALMPYLSHVLGIMRTQVTDTVPTMAVDESARLYVNEQFIATLAPTEVAYCLLHEVLHIVLSHGRRFRTMVPDAGERERYCWNVSADLCIQQMLARHMSAMEPHGIVKIDGCLPTAKDFANGGPRFLDIPGLTRGMSTEQYYGLLLPFMPEDKDIPKPQSGDGQDDKGGEPQPLDPKDAGSNSHGGRGKEEKQSTVVEEAMLQNALESALRDMEEAESGMPGTVPGGLVRTLSVRLRRQPDPFEELKRVVSRSVASPLGIEEYTYRRLSRRQQPDGARKRGVVRYSPECVIVVDTSGSMSGAEQRALTAVAQGLRKVQQPRVVLYDHAMQDSRRLSAIDQFQWKGYGGTDMATAIATVDKEYRPDAIVCITDGATRWPATQTRARLVVALVRNAANWSVPAWAKVVHCYKEVARYES